MKQHVNIKVSPRGMSFAGMLTIIFVIAKIAGLISWSWWLVFLPVYALPLVAITFGLIALAVGLVIVALS